MWRSLRSFGISKSGSSSFSSSGSARAFILRLIFPVLVFDDFGFHVVAYREHGLWRFDPFFRNLGNMYQTGDMVSQINESAVGLQGFYRSLLRYFPP